MRWATLFLLLTSPSTFADDHFENRVRPLLVEKCQGCHGVQALSGLRLNSRAALLQGGTRGPGAVPGNAASSLLYQVVAHTHPQVRMPPTGKLTSAELQALKTWIDSGAPWPEASSAKPTAGPPKPALWSAEPLPARPSGTIDSHVRAGLAAKGLTLNPRADRRTLLRRLTFDLTGLPPTPTQAARFLNEKQPVAELIDSLLASPQYGERWARHWLDVVRYGEEDFSGTEPKPYTNAWRYRDWIIQALNRDLPYDEFVRAQIAADLYPQHRDNLAALGLFGLGPWYYGISQPPQARADERHDRVDMVSRGFLGLTAACARCHDHKYDPIPQRDYYALAGVFASSAYREYPLAPDAEVQAHQAAQERIRKLEKEIQSFLNSQREQLAEIYARQTAAFLNADPTTDPDIRQRLQTYLAKPEEDFNFLKPWQTAADPTAKAQAARDFQALLTATIEQKKQIEEENRKAVIRGTPIETGNRRKEILPGNYDSEADFNPGADVPTKSLDRERFQLYQKFLARNDAVYRLDDAQVEKRLSGEFKRHLDALRAELDLAKKTAPKPHPFLHGLAEHDQPIDLPLNLRGSPTSLGPSVERHFLTCLASGAPARWTHGSGRRELTEAILAHPLAARVMANRVWAWLMGAGIVRTPSNFGNMGDRPANPALLDDLAARLVHHKFSLKALIREIVLSDTYQAASTVTAEGRQIDPDNRLFWRANRKRLDAESIRDAMLAASGELNLQAGGESAPLDDANLRRTVYVRVSRYQQNETLALFDLPSASVHAEQRNVTNVPLQKLFFLNSTFLQLRSQALAKRAAGPRDLYPLLFQRQPTPVELAKGEAFLATHSAAQYAQVLLSANEFLYLD